MWRGGFYQLVQHAIGVGEEHEPVARHAVAVGTIETSSPVSTTYTSQPIMLNIVNEKKLTKARIDPVK